MPTDKSRNRQPAPIVKDARLPVAYDLVRNDDDSIVKLPAKSPVGTMTVLRFTKPTMLHPNGAVVCVGYPPFSPTKIGMRLVRRY